MSSTADTDDVIEVSADGLAVRKTFAADEFPVPAIRFEIESDRNESVAFRLSEDIPESFPMDKVGFHPDYHSDDWTAFQDNHVEFTGALEPGERLVTVYGIRIDDESDAEPFLTEPAIVEVSAESTGSSGADEIEDGVVDTIVSEDRNQSVKDMISGESDGVPGLDDDEDSDSGDEPGELDLDLGDVDPDPEADDEDDEDDMPDIDLGFDDEDGPEIDEADGDEPDFDESDEDAQIEIGPGDDEDVVDTSADSPADDDAGSIDLDFDESTTTDDPDTTDDETDETAPATSDDETDETAPTTTDDETDETDETDADPEPDESSPSETPEPASAADDAAPGTATVDGSISTRLATELREDEIDDDDLEALRSELDLEPSGPDVAKVDHLQSRVEEVAAYTDALETFLEDNGTGKQLVESIQSDIASIEDDLAAMDDRLSGTEDRLEDVETDVEAVGTDVDGVETELEAVAGDVDTVEETVDDLDEDVDDLGDDVEDVEDDLEDLETELENVRADVTDIQDWRDQLGSMFSE